MATSTGLPPIPTEWYGDATRTGLINSLVEAMLDMSCAEDGADQYVMAHEGWQMVNTGTITRAECAQTADATVHLIFLLHKEGVLLPKGELYTGGSRRARDADMDPEARMMHLNSLFLHFKRLVVNACRDVPFDNNKAKKTTAETQRRLFVSQPMTSYMAARRNGSSRKNGYGKANRHPPRLRPLAPAAPTGPPQVITPESPTSARFSSKARDLEQALPGVASRDNPQPTDIPYSGEEDEEGYYIDYGNSDEYNDEDSDE